MIYLASPYTHADPAVMEQRYEDVLEVVASLAASSLVVYSPIVHFHEVAKKYNLPRDYAFWQIQNIGMLKKADYVMVLRLEGWETSVGICGELEQANALHIPVTYGDKETYQWQE